MNARIIQGDSLTILKTLPDESVHCVVTSPPYWGQRDYGTPGQLGLEPTPEAHLEIMVTVFREVRRVLRADGTTWVNYGDGYASRTDGSHGGFSAGTGGPRREMSSGNGAKLSTGLKKKDLVGMPWRIAFALQADGWYLRSDIIWHKPNPMPESVTDRPTKSHEYIFLLSKSPKYFYDADAIKEPVDARNHHDATGGPASAGTKQDNSGLRRYVGFNERYFSGEMPERKNKRDVWTVPTEPYRGAHFATFPKKLIEPCILAGCPERGTVLDPFCGSGTTGLVAQRHSRSFVGIELNPEFAEMAQARIRNDLPLFSSVDVTQGDDTESA